ncbi:MAG: Sca4 family spreading effector [Rickettsia endosymbiont of Ixodes persulcatus]|nr:Sca4 family spreading effector [Rickettsia endosymbiont of Ixodes persulcatus]MCZ6902256.1 Sca4 family spreading effector [Rickettsia endosymbiont of Ixodes persulcatus]MCZ6903807.1 Sca4 family spreading effector [Rickettsia endosymbiont of Ixodes persulcatus]MCZ6908674.1 Sca4 family spreading effector [Rickettsia endosymbiont of Ixodes persulcatus]MCZ6909577.1 Sca4 family spreading effector [Rickettsia endosymbiont of Ixodes persulcatus]
MSKDGNPDTSELDPLANREFTEEEKQQQAKQEQELFSQTTLDAADDGFIVTPASSAQSTPSISALSESISADGQTSDQITEAIRKEILKKQRDILREYFANTNPELAEQIAKEEEDKKFRAFLSNPDNRGLIDKAFEDSETKKKLEAAEITGYRNVLSTYSTENYKGGFKLIQWENQVSASNLRATVVKNDAGDGLCTLNETTHKTKPFTVAKQDGTQVQVSSYRAIDFPIKLDKADGSMHLSMVALKADGTKPSKDKAVYFTAHYEEGPNGKPLLKEISSPQPLKFAGDRPDAVAYIEHGEEIYTLAVTRGKYQEMMQEVELNKGQAIDLSQTIAEDLTKVQGRFQETPQPIITPNQGLKSSIEMPTVIQMPQLQQAESSGIPNPVLNTVTALSGSMQDLLNYVNAGLTKETDGNKQIDLIKEAAAAILNNEKSDIAEKQANIIALVENTVNNKDLAPDAKVAAGVGSILESIKSDNALSDPEKSKMLEATVAIALNSENLEPKYKQQIVEKAVDSGLGLDDANARANTIDGITDAIIKSNLATEDKGTMLIAVGDKVNTSQLSNAEKQKLLGSVLKKGVEAGVLSEEQQQLMRQNLDKITAEQEKASKVAEVLSVLANPAFNNIAKTKEIQDVTTKVLDAPVKADVKGEIIEGITKTVAESSLDAKDKADIVKGVGETITSHSNTSLMDKITIMESAEKGIAEGKTDLPVRELMTKGLVEGVYESKADPEITSETKAVSNGIDKSTAVLEDKQALKDAASGAVLDRETQNLNKDLSQSVEQTKLRDDIYNKAQDVADALKNVVDPVLAAHPEKREVSEEEVVKKTFSVLSDVSKLAVEKVNNFRVMLSPNGNLKTLEAKRAESEKEISKIVNDYKAIDEKYKPQYEQQQGSYNNTKELEEKKSFIENLKLDDKEKIKLISTLIQSEAENKKKGTINNITMLTENRTKLEEKVAIQDKSKVGYNTQLKPRKDTAGRVP